MNELLKGFNDGYEQRMQEIHNREQDVEATLAKAKEKEEDLIRYVRDQSWVNAVLMPLAKALARKLGWTRWDASKSFEGNGYDPSVWAHIWLGEKRNEDKQTSLSLYCEEREGVATIYYKVNKYRTPKTATKEIQVGGEIIKIALLPDTVEEILELLYIS